MKKLLALVLIAVMLVGTAACGQKSSKNTDTLACIFCYPTESPVPLDIIAIEPNVG